MTIEEKIRQLARECEYVPGVGEADHEVDDSVDVVIAYLEELLRAGKRAPESIEWRLYIERDGVATGEDMASEHEARTRAAIEAADYPPARCEIQRREVSVWETVESC
jgi:hypothetical protein